MSTDDNTEGRLSRWSKRKLKNSDEETENQQDAETSLEENKEELEARELELAANREAAEEIDLDSIDEESDLSLFMKEGVPEALKKAALAKLWRSNPIFANVDGLVDYDDNFADPKLIMKTFTSAYQVGRGYLKEVLEDEPETLSDVAELQSETTTDKQDTQTPVEDEDNADESNDEELNTQAETQSEAETDDQQPTETIAVKVEPEEETLVPASIKKVSLRQRFAMMEASEDNG